MKDEKESEISVFDSFSWGTFSAARR